MDISENEFVNLILISNNKELLNVDFKFNNYIKLGNNNVYFKINKDI